MLARMGTIANPLQQRQIRSSKDKSAPAKIQLFSYSIIQLFI